jgi:hypothetical protein
MMASESVSSQFLNQRPWAVHLARQILESDEPEVRSYQMLRYLFGAYEPLDEALSVLRSPGLVIRRKQGAAGHTVRAVIDG